MVDGNLILMWAHLLQQRGRVFQQDYHLQYGPLHGT